MQKTIAERIGDLFDDFRFNLSHLSKVAMGKVGIKTAADALEIGAVMLVGILAGDNRGTGGYDLNGTLALGLGLPLSVAFSAYMVAKEAEHKEATTRDEFQPEIAAHVGKKRAEPLTAADQEAAAKKSGTLAEGLTQNALHRDVSTAISIGSTVLGGLTVAGLKLGWFGGWHAFDSLKSVTEKAMDGILSHGMAHGAAMLTAAAAAGLIAVALYYAVKIPAHYIAEKMFGMERETAQDKIHEIVRTRARGKAVQPELVMEAALERYALLKNAVRLQFGRDFSNLRPPQREEVLNTLGERLNVRAMAEAINNGARAQELAFALDGEASGANMLFPAPSKEALNTVLTNPAQSFDAPAKSAAAEPQAEEMPEQPHAAFFVRKLASQRGHEGPRSAEAHAKAIVDQLFRPA